MDFKLGDMVSNNLYPGNVYELTPFARAPHPYRSIKDIRDNKT
jgi:hypothetical protein